RSNLLTVPYVTEQMKDAGEITCRKMFGEYGVYCDGKIFALICDDQLFLKITKEGRKICPDLQEALPYEGAKPYFLVEELDDRELMTRLVQETVKALPEPKKKKKK
ncbi:MAG: TfoX/Sxy family protein, partial [Lachnospiraceae bacterium]|nr:TfoX/Sxy family protein [Lachnospiraceae bacterium]